MYFSKRVVRLPALAFVLALFPGLTIHDSSIPALVRNRENGRLTFDDPPKSLTKSSAIKEHIFTGAGATDRFGLSVASAGDVNGDGYSDVIVGAYHNDAGGSDAGRAYIYFGGSSIDDVADVILTGAAATDYFGISVSAAGDVNGDGYSDVVVGAYGNVAGGSNAGRAYIYFGGAGMNSTADVVLTGAAVGDYFGYSVAGAGDVNGDGFGDVVVGSYLNDAGGTSAGRVYVYFGGASMNSTSDVVLTGSAASDYFGHSVAGAGDANGDGYSDVIVGARLNDAGGVDAGRAYVYFGGASMNSSVDVIMTGAAAGDQFGHSVASAGDVNGDGYDDVVSGAVSNDAGGFAAGRAYVYFGGASMNGFEDVILTGFAANDQFGYTTASAGDVNGDGYSDVVAGTWGNDAGGTDAGRAYVYFGGASMNSTVDAIFTGAVGGDHFGNSVAGAGDVNGDGSDDVIVGAPDCDAPGTDVGRVWLYSISLTGTDTADEWFTGAATVDYFGCTVASAGDVNGDGFSDVIVGAKYNDAGGSNAGRAYIFFGGVSVNSSPDVTLTGEAAADNLGNSVAAAGDVNGDGYGDVIVGAENNDAGGATAGRAYVYFGGASINNAADVTLTGAAAGDYFGHSVAGAGDVNRDGYNDVIVGANHNDASGSGAGSAYLYFGGTTMDSSADVSLVGDAAGDYFGQSVAPAGDVNGDGYGDVIVGAYRNDDGGADAGRAYVFFGGETMNSSTDIWLNGAAAGDNFGVSVASAGDVNGDGYSDVIVGADHNDDGGTMAGRAYIFFGGVNIDSSPDVTLTGSGPVDELGVSVASAGDVNGDGYSDVIAGASYNDAGGLNAGRAYVFFGGVSMDSSPDVTMTGAASLDYFGSSAASAGDVNGDGYDDVIVGAANNDAVGADAGRAYLYLTSSPPIVPRVISAQDVPGDQGGYVRVRWMRSGYDTRGTGRLEEYILQRSDPPGSTGFVWDYVTTVPAIRQPFYSFVVPTTSDSMTGSGGTTYFRVLARGTNPDELWTSASVGAHSVDNLSPATPGGSSANPLANGPIEVCWNPNRTDPDLSHFIVYRSTTSGIPLGECGIICTTTDTAAVDSSTVVGQQYFYRITAADIHGNQSAPTIELSQTALAVQLLSFTASAAKEQEVILEWTAAAEGGSLGFEVQRRRADETNWNTIGFVASSGTTSGSQQYSFADRTVQPGTHRYRLRQVNHDGTSVFFQELEVTIALPKEFALDQNFPNPFNPTTEVRYQISDVRFVRLSVCDVRGRQVGVLAEGEMQPGYYTVRWDASAFTSGVYFLRMEAGGFRQVRRMTLMK